MNREIKFRAWSKETKKMMDWEFIKGHGNLNKLLTLNHVEVMQFTGITNTDTKSELYESDIIEFKANYVTQGKLSGYIIGVIVWDYDSWKIKVGENLYSISDETDEFYYKFKVLGNIYETPELLCN